MSSNRGLKLQELDNQTTTANGTVTKPDVAVKPNHINRPTSLLTKRVSKKKQKQAEIEARQLFSFFDLEHQEQENAEGKKGNAATKTKVT